MMTRIQAIVILTFIFVGTIFSELSIYSFKQSPSSKMTLLQHMQPSLSFPTVINGYTNRLIILCIFFVLLRFLFRWHQLGILIYYITFLKFLEFIPLTVDIINILFIYQHKLKDIDYHQNTSNRLILTFIFALIRFIFSLNVIQRKCDCRWKRQRLLLLDLLLFVLINISLIRYEDNNVIRSIRVGRKLMLGVLLYKLNSLYYDDSFWMNHFIRNNNLSLKMMKMIETILYLRWIVSILIICLFIFYSFESMMINEIDDDLFFMRHIKTFIKTRSLVVLLCLLIAFISYWDTMQNRTMLKRYGFLPFCIGFDLFSQRHSTDLSDSFSVKPITTDSGYTKSTSVTKKRPLQTSSTNQKTNSDGYFKQFYSWFKDVQNKMTKPTSLVVGKGTIEVAIGDITKQIVDVIVGSSSSEHLKKVLLKAGGDQVEKAFTKEYQNNPYSLIISTPPGLLKCKRIFFLKWEPDQDQDILQQSLIDLIGNVIQNAQAHKFTSIAFPAIGCGRHGCSINSVVKIMVKEMKQQLLRRKLSLTVKFIIHSNQENLYKKFCKELLSSDQLSHDDQLPSTWTKSDYNKLYVLVPTDTDEYKSIFIQFDTAMKGKYKRIIKLERIQNERWYMQYMAHVKDFQKRLNQDTEKRLYHGCPEEAAQSIVQDCFNRSFAGVNGTIYGVGVYFSSDAVYSHRYAKLNRRGERHMFLARVLIGRTTYGNSSMKTRPDGFDSTTDGKHIFVTYHDAQAYAEYLITYKGFE